MLPSLGISEWLIIAFIIVLLFGGKKIPELFRGIGQAFREFKKATKGEADKPK